MSGKRRTRYEWRCKYGFRIILDYSSDRAACDSDIMYQDRKAGTGIGYRKTGRLPDDMGHRLHFKMPVIDRVARKVDLKEQVVDFAPQPVITKDNVTMRIDTVVFYQITDPKMFCYGVANPIMAIENLTATTLRNIIGDLELDQTLTSRETINTKMSFPRCGDRPVGYQS